MIRRALPFLIPVLCLCCTLDAAAQGKQTRKVYRWVDEAGQVHYSNTIPPQYAQQDRDVMNRQGVAVDRVVPAVPVDMALDHTLTVDFHGFRDAQFRNMELDIQRKSER